MQPDDANFYFDLFYNSLGKKGYLIYPGKLTIANTFRIGCIGHLTSNDMHNALKAIQETAKELQVQLN
jgi:2-aminoethylphosphonate-pyruvate transaminase